MLKLFIIFLITLIINVNSIYSIERFNEKRDSIEQDYSKVLEMVIKDSNKEGDLQGWQAFYWGMNIDEVKKIIKESSGTYKIDNLKTAKTSESVIILENIEILKVELKPILVFVKDILVSVRLEQNYRRRNPKELIINSNQIFPEGYSRNDNNKIIEALNTRYGKPDYESQTENPPSRGSRLRAHVITFIYTWIKERGMVTYNKKYMVELFNTPHISLPFTEAVMEVKLTILYCSNHFKELTELIEKERELLNKIDNFKKQQKFREQIGDDL